VKGLLAVGEKESARARTCDDGKICCSYGYSSFNSFRPCVLVALDLVSR